MWVVGHFSLAGRSQDARFRSQTRRVPRWHMRRRDFITLLGGGTATWSVIARAQQAPRHPIIAVLSPISSAAATRNIEALRIGLRDLGYSKVATLHSEIRYADGAIERLAELVAELVALKPDVIVAGSPAAALAVRSVTARIPVVINSSLDPVNSWAGQQYGSARWQCYRVLVGRRDSCRQAATIAQGGGARYDAGRNYRPSRRPKRRRSQTSTNSR